MSFIRFIFLLPLVLTSLFVPEPIAAQRNMNCRSETNRPAPRYRTGWKTYSVEGPKTLFLAISIDARRFSRDDLMALAQRINEVYCREQRLVVAILDDYRAARAFAPTNEKLWFKQHWRGDYFLDRNSGEEELSFSTTPDKPKNEVKLTLARPDRK